MGQLPFSERLEWFYFLPTLMSVRAKVSDQRTSPWGCSRQPHSTQLSAKNEKDPAHPSHRYVLAFLRLCQLLSIFNYPRAKLTGYQVESYGKKNNKVLVGFHVSVSWTGAGQLPAAPDPAQEDAEAGSGGMQGTCETGTVVAALGHLQPR